MKTLEVIIYNQLDLKNSIALGIIIREYEIKGCY